METFTKEEVWLIAIASGFAGMIILVIFAAIIWFFDTFIYKPYKNHRKPLIYHGYRRKF